MHYHSNILIFFEEVCILTLIDSSVVAQNRQNMPVNCDVKVKLQVMKLFFYL